MRRTIGRLASALWMTVVVLLLGGALVARGLASVLARAVVHLFVMAGLLIALVYVRCAIRVRQLGSKLRKLAR